MQMTAMTGHCILPELVLPLEQENPQALMVPSAFTLRSRTMKHLGECQL